MTDLKFADAQRAARQAWSGPGVIHLELEGQGAVVVHQRGHRVPFTVTRHNLALTPDKFAETILAAPLQVMNAHFKGK